MPRNDTSVDQRAGRQQRENESSERDDEGRGVSSYFWEIWIIWECHTMEI
jgi:hypothetical protein